MPDDKARPSERWTKQEALTRITELEQERERLRNGIRGIAGQLDTPTGLNVSPERQVDEYASRCLIAADRLRRLSGDTP